MEHEEVRTELDRIAARLQDDGLAPAAGAEERQCHLWRELVGSEGKLLAASQELQALRTQQAGEMKEVESYVEHIRGLLEEREMLTTEYERDNEQLRLELKQSRLLHENQSKELVELLSQEGLGDVGLSSPSEQVAYLLVERATLLERLEAAERRLDSQSLTGSLREVHLQEEVEHVRRTLGQELLKTRDNMTKCSSQSTWRKLFGPRRSSAQSRLTSVPLHEEEVSQERGGRQGLERDLEEASRRLAMAHQDIRRLTAELDAARKNQQDHDGDGSLGLSGAELERTEQEVENLRKEVDKLKHCDMVELQKARDQNERLDGEIRVLRERVRALDTEKKTLLDKLAQQELEQASSVKPQPQGEGKGRSGELQSNVAPLWNEEEHVHKRCREALEDGRVQLRELQRRLQKQRADQEELVERNEELEALVGETQNASKEERQRHDGELEGLRRKIKSLEAELKKQFAQDRLLKNVEESKESEPYFQPLRGVGSSQERVSLLEARLTEEKDWRKQLEVDLTSAQGALKKDKEALQMGERELKKLRMEVNSLQTECQQGKTLIKSLTQVKGEKAVLEEKLAQLERTHARLQGELERQRESGGAKEDLRESRAEVEQLRDQTYRLTSELASLRTAHDALREELGAEKLQSSGLQADLRSGAQETLSAQGERDRLGLEVQQLQQRLELQLEEHHASTRSSSQEPLTKPSPGGPVEQLPSVKRDPAGLQADLEEERRRSARRQLALQAQATEAQARAKSQDMVLGQKAEEARQLKQDLQRVQSLFTSAERELRYEREKNVDLKRHNVLLDQEKLKLCAEVKQSAARLLQVEQKVQGLGSECERQQQRIREQELELARSSTTRSTTSSLQEELQAERARLIAADKKVVELQQQLKNSQHQLRMEEARSGESSRLERDTRDLTDSLSSLRAQHHEDHITRKLLEQREEELRQQVRSLRQKEASLGRSNSELGLKSQQLESRLTLLEEELSQAREEREAQSTNHQLQEELLSSQQETDKLQGEIQLVLLQLDTHVRRHNEKQEQQRSKLRQARQACLKATGQRDRTIQRLENDLELASSLSLKEKESVRTVMAENEKLLVEKRDLLRRTSEAEDLGSAGMRTASTVQHRVNGLEQENRQLQDRTLKLSNQVSCLERALRNVQSFCSLEHEVRKMLPPEGLTMDSMRQSSSLSLTSGACDPLGILDAICRVKGEGPRVAPPSAPQFQPSELGYLNVTSPGPGGLAETRHSAERDQV
ncbi:coiled-coil domain-containing protein 30 isoform X2 [Gadus macrocephalus]|uniref:coiled-coil domain-containing protein 30 isoform X2 n=1 Tax=Gadus macrocephalus TaxID=80720 RepID=UPI0028CB6933|nr:coiled-coil domain-containing protein 30 isoform X2 [Gadus macrocephalus]